jgi:chromosome segregation ATPase
VVSPSQSSPATRELQLLVREAELDRREAALRDDAEQRDRALERALEAVETQRTRLAEVRAEYEARRETLTARTREVEAERDRLRNERARLIGTNIELEDRARAGAGVAPLAPVPGQRRQPLESA